MNENELHGIEPEVWALLTQRVIKTLQTFGLTPAVQRAIRYARGRASGRLPYWLRNTPEPHLSAFEADYAEHEQRQWEDERYD